MKPASVARARHIREAGAGECPLKGIAAENHGVAGRAFVRRILEARKDDRNKLAAWIEARRAFYVGKARAQITLSSRNLKRLHGKFATIYAEGAFLHPWKRDEPGLVFVCERPTPDNAV